MAISCRPCWQNCGVNEPDEEMLAIDEMEDALAPLDEQASQIRKLISGFELCYHEANKEAERLVKAIGSGRCPPHQSSRPPRRQAALQNTRDILSLWCEDPTIRGLDLDVEGVAADQLLSYLGKATPLKLWQVQRIIDKVTEALDPKQPYRRMALTMGDYGESDAEPLDDYYQDSKHFLEETQQTLIHDRIDGQEANMSLAMAIDLFMPCHWNFVGSLEILLKAIGGDLHPTKPYACCSRNVRLSPLYTRVKTIARTLECFCKDKADKQDVDHELLAALGESSPVKRWLAASLDKTIRLQLEGDTEMWLDFTGGA